MKQSFVARAWRELSPSMRIAIIVIVVVVVGLVFVPKRAHAEDLTATNGQDTVRLSSEPCSHAGTLIVWRKRLRADVPLYNARAHVRGEDFFGCWTIDGDEAHIFYEDGDHGLVPLTNFVPGARHAAPKPDA